MKPIIIHILEVDVKETDSATGAELETVSARIVSSDTTLTGDFQITETDPTQFGGYEVGKNYSLTPTLVVDSAVPATTTEESTTATESIEDTAKSEASSEPAGDSAPQV